MKDPDFDGLTDRAMHESDLEAESAWRSHSYMAAEQQQHEEMRRDVERVCELACQHLGPSDQALLRWACGIPVQNPPKEQMAMWDPDSEKHLF